MTGNLLPAMKGLFKGIKNMVHNQKLITGFRLERVLSVSNTDSHRKQGFTLISSKNMDWRATSGFLRNLISSFLNLSSKTATLCHVTLLTLFSILKLSFRVL